MSAPKIKRSKAPQAQRISVMVYVVSRDKPDWESAFGLMTALRVADRAGIHTELRVRKQESLVCRGRNNALYDFMQTPCDFLMFVDDDVEVPGDAIVKLVRRDKDVIAGIYRLKNPEKIKAAIRMDDLDLERRAVTEGLCTPAIYVSTGCFMVKRSALEHMCKSYPELEHDRLNESPTFGLFMPFIYTEPNGFREYLSEDWAFCRRALTCGLEVWVDGSIRARHMGLTAYDFPPIQTPELPDTAV